MKIRIKNYIVEVKIKAVAAKNNGTSMRAFAKIVRKIPKTEIVHI